jgi:hypothetical protein
LTVAGQAYRYHASAERIVAAPGDEGQPPGGRITIGGPNIGATFPFDLDGPPAPQSPATEDDPALLLSNAAEVLSQASADLDGDGVAELVFLAGFGGAPERLGYDSLALLVLTPSTSAEAVAGYELA